MIEEVRQVTSKSSSLLYQRVLIHICYRLQKKNPSYESSHLYLAGPQVIMTTIIFPLEPQVALSGESLLGEHFDGSFQSFCDP